MFSILDVKLDQLEDYIARVADVCVMFSISGCPPCSVLHKAIEQHGDTSSELEFVRCILTPRQAFAAFSEGVLRTVPALALYRGGEQIHVLDGIAPESEDGAWEVVKGFVASG